MRTVRVPVELAAPPSCLVIVVKMPADWPAAEIAAGSRDGAGFGKRSAVGAGTVGQRSLHSYDVGARVALYPPLVAVAAVDATDDCRGDEAALVGVVVPVLAVMVAVRRR